MLESTAHISYNRQRSDETPLEPLETFDFEAFDALDEDIYRQVKRHTGSNNRGLGSRSLEHCAPPLHQSAILNEHIYSRETTLPTAVPESGGIGVGGHRSHPEYSGRRYPEIEGSFFPATSSTFISIEPAVQKDRAQHPSNTAVTNQFQHAPSSSRPVDSVQYRSSMDDSPWLLSEVGQDQYANYSSSATWTVPRSQYHHTPSVPNYHNNVFPAVNDQMTCSFPKSGYRNTLHEVVHGLYD